MKKEKNISDEVDATLEVLQRISQVEPNAFLYEKTMNRMQTVKEPMLGRSLFFRQSLAVVLVLLVVNAFTFVYLSKNMGSNETKASRNYDLVSDYRLDESQNNY